MSTCIVLNHHSLKFNDIESAKHGFLDFIEILQQLPQNGISTVLTDTTIDKTLMNLEIANKFYVRDWCRIYKNEFKDAICALKTKVTKKPLEYSPQENDRSQAIEVYINDCTQESLPALVAAYILNNFIISFQTGPTWMCDHLKIYVYDISLSLNEGNFKQAYIKNIYDKKSFSSHKADIESLRDNLLKDAKDVWTQRDILYPNLIFLKNQVGDTLLHWPYKNTVLRQFKESINILEKFTSKLKNNEFQEYRASYLRNLGLNHEVSGESKSIRENNDEVKKRTFFTMSGEKLVCFDHIKLTGGYRLYFKTDNKEKKTYIWRIGPHL